MAFTIVSILTGLTGLYTLGFTYGGPVVITWGWLVSVLFTCTVAARSAMHMISRHSQPAS
jgi:hypothetical protein